MAGACVVAVYEDMEQAQEAVYILSRGGFPLTQVSLVTKGRAASAEVRNDIQMGDDSPQDAAIGAGLGAIAGVLTGIAVAVVSGATVIFLAGPIGIGLAGAVVGAFLGGMGGWGVHQERVAHYESLVKQGQTLVVAHGDPLQVVQADRMLQETAPREIHIYTKTGSESPEVNPQENIPSTAASPAAKR